MKENNFIAKFPKAFSDEYCDKVIKLFERSCKIGTTSTRRKDVVRRDTQADLNSNFWELPETDDVQEVATYTELDLRSQHASEEFFEVLNESMVRYIEELGLETVINKEEVWAKNALVQRSEASKFDSYSAWHCEAANRDSSDRVFVYVLYLNDDFEGGETQFRYQLHNEKPEKGSLIIWPAGYTHVHRGNMITSGTKYILTGWFYY